MNILSDEEKGVFVGQIKALRQQLHASKAESIVHSLGLFENQFTLVALELCLTTAEFNSCAEQLIQLFAARWQRIRNSSMCYTKQPYNPVNQLCLEVARAIADIGSNFEELEPDTGPYFLLMPSLEQYQDINGENIHSLGLHEFALSDNERIYIPLSACLQQACVSDAGQFRHIVTLDDEFPLLTDDEITRIASHSQQANDWYHAAIAFNHQRLLCDTIGAKLSQLALALRAGGVLKKGEEYDAGSAANLGIHVFSEYWHTLSQWQKSAIYAETPPLAQVLGRLFRPKDAEYEKSIFCVELLANDLDPIIAVYNAKPAMNELKDKLDTCEAAFNHALQNPQELKLIADTQPPRHILHHIFKLDTLEQAALFQKQYADALIYALANEAEALALFELDDMTKEWAVTAPINDNSDTALIVATQKKDLDTMRLVVSWGAALEAYNKQSHTALHRAAASGYTDGVAYLLEQGALVDAKDKTNNTALHFAVSGEHTAVVHLLLENNACLNARNDDHHTAFDWAVRYDYPQLVELLLRRMALLPAELQADCLAYDDTDSDSDSDYEEGLYPNVLFYAADQEQGLFDTLLDIILRQADETVRQTILFSTNKYGITVLMLAAGMNSQEYMDDLLAIDLDINACDEMDNTALHLVAKEGLVDMVNCLLEHGANIDALNDKKNTPLFNAIRKGHDDVVKLLIRQNADIKIRNDAGMNAIDGARKYCLNSIKPLLKRLAALSAAEQAECLSSDSKQHDYPNALYATDNPELFCELLDSVIQQPDETNKRALLNSANKQGVTPLIIAASIDSLDAVIKLIDAGVDINIPALNQNNALHHAVLQGHGHVVRCLVVNGAFIEAQGASNNTALNLAILSKQRAIAQLLLDEHANINARNDQGFNALDLTLQHDPEFIAPLLMHMLALPLEEQAQCLIHVSGGPFCDVVTYVATERPQLISELFCSTNSASQEEEAILTHMDFDRHMAHIHAHYLRMNDKAPLNAKYADAALAAKTLLIACARARVCFVQSREELHEKIHNFKNSCFTAIKQAKPVLSTHREWGRLLAGLILALITLPISLPLYALGFFSSKTKSAQLLDALSDGMSHSRFREPNF